MTTILLIICFLLIRLLPVFFDIRDWLGTILENTYDIGKGDSYHGELDKIYDRIDSLNYKLNDTNQLLNIMGTTRHLSREVGNNINEIKSGIYKIEESVRFLTRVNDKIGILHFPVHKFIIIVLNFVNFTMIIN